MGGDPDDHNNLAKGANNLVRGTAQQNSNHNLVVGADSIAFHQQAFLAQQRNAQPDESEVNSSTGDDDYVGQY